MNHLTYVRPDGAVGVGFKIVHSAKKMHSIAWPDRCAERMLDDELARKQIRIHESGASTSSSSFPSHDSTPSVSPPSSTDPEASAESSESVSDVPEVPERSDSPADNDDAQTTSDPVHETETETEPVSEAQAIRDYLTANPKATNKDAVEALAEQGVEISSSQVTRQRKNLKEDGVI